MDCVLCTATTVEVWPAYKDEQRYAHCRACDLRFLDPSKRLMGAEERSRYTLHQTAAGDPGYRNFVGPLIHCLTETLPAPASGLDYGAGHQPVLAEHLRELGYTIAVYDPFFWPGTGPLGSQYDFVVACEVAEHFFDPAAEFAKLRGLVRPGGHLLLNTEIYDPKIDFENWYYRRDPTHVVFYSAPTLKWIGRRFGFKEVWLKGRVASLR